MHQDLLEQARSLSTIDAKKPKQANLRRAVSSAYYALFHFLVGEACRISLGTQNDAAPYRRVLARAFDHACMKKACESFKGGNLPACIGKGLPATFAVPAEVRRLAATFVDAQGKRHLADYDLTERFSRQEALLFIQQAGAAIQQFEGLSSGHPKSFFLVSLLTWNTLSRRG